MTGTGLAPRRVLIVSADIGEGHNAAGRALAEAAPRAWPGCEVGWLDALEAIGYQFGRLARRFYVTQVRSTPAAYDYFYFAMWRHRWYLDSTRSGMGALFGRRMASPIAAFAPDVIMSTYPLGSAGLSWLRRRGLLNSRVGAWVPAFCPHPAWLYPALDQTYVMDSAAVKVAARAEPGMPLAVGALPVRDGFAPASPAGQAVALERLGLAPGDFTVLVSTGSLGFGRVERTVAAILAAGPQVRAIVTCGRNRGLQRQLAARGWPPRRLRVTGWSDEMPTLMAAADLVVSNGGGGTALEAIASARPVLITDPVPGHGRDNASLMATAGLALLAPTPASLTTTVARLAGDQGAVAALAQAAATRAALRRREDDLADLLSGGRQDPGQDERGAPASRHPHRRRFARHPLR
ncbi:MAG TPA: glycosyltransferase [Trebonia sp.]|nr:glycosyltransferase [Trebonia sp.]